MIETGYGNVENVKASSEERSHPSAVRSPDQRFSDEKKTEQRRSSAAFHEIPAVGGKKDNRYKESGNEYDNPSISLNVAYVEKNGAEPSECCDRQEICRERSLGCPGENRLRFYEMPDEVRPREPAEEPRSEKMEKKCEHSGYQPN
jgi:hypothetical protein